MDSKRCMSTHLKYLLKKLRKGNQMENPMNIGWLDLWLFLIIVAVRRWYGF